MFYVAVNDVNPGFLLRPLSLLHLSLVTFSTSNLPKLRKHSTPKHQQRWAVRS